MLTTVLAQIDLSPAGPFAGITPENLTITNIITWGFSAILVLAAVVFFFMLIFGGIRWMISGGDKANTETARNQVTGALIGLIIVFSAWAIWQILATAFGATGGITDLGGIGGTIGSP